MAYLTAEQERDLTVRWHRHKDEKALHKLILAFQPMAKAMVRKYRGYGQSDEDMLSEANVGLLEAAKRFDPDHGNRFNAYAQWYVRAALQEFVVRNASLIKPSMSSAGRLAFYRDGKPKPVLSLDASVLDDGTTLAEAIPGEPVDLDGALDQEREAGWVREAVATLKGREARIIRDRLLTEDRISLEEIGGALGVSKERVRQIQNRALERLKKRLLKDHPELAVA